MPSCSQPCLRCLFAHQCGQTFLIKFTVMTMHAWVQVFYMKKNKFVCVCPRVAAIIRANFKIPRPHGFQLPIWCRICFEVWTPRAEIQTNAHPLTEDNHRSHRSLGKGSWHGKCYTWCLILLDPYSQMGGKHWTIVRALLKEDACSLFTACSPTSSCSIKSGGQRHIEYSKF